MNQNQVKYIDPEIFYVENVLEPDELEYLQDFCKNSGEWVSVLGLESESLWNNNTKHVSDDRAAMAIHKVNLAMAELVNSDIAVHHPHYNVNRYTPKSNPKVEGSTWWDDDEWSLNPHWDNAYGTLPEGSEMIYGVIFYINDDYTGGEVSYTEKNITFKPKPNTILAHSGKEEYIHGVKKVTSGERYTLATFAFNPGSIYL
jgi:hypothetical protein